MQADEEVGKIASATPVVVSKCLELFVTELCKKTLDVCKSQNSRTITPPHVQTCVQNEKLFDFLKDITKNFDSSSKKRSRQNQATESDAVAKKHKKNEGQTIEDKGDQDEEDEDEEEGAQEESGEEIVSVKTILSIRSWNKKHK